MNVNAIPLELSARKQWVAWTYVSVPDKPKPTKQPRRAFAPHAPASVTNPKTWATFDQAVAALDRPEVDGIGYVFSPDDPYLGIDLDDGVSVADQAAIMLALDSYAETSVSGAGVHVIVRASLNGHGRNRKGPFEVYDHDRYFTFTGDHVRGTPTTIEDRQEQLEQVLSHFLPKAEPIESISVRAPVPVDLDDVELIDKASSARNGRDFAALYAGIWEGRHRSQSEADFALCSMLAFWTGADPDRIDHLFRTSGLYRAKWDRSDYRDRTIGNGIRGCSGTYSELSHSSRPGRDGNGTGTASSSVKRGNPFPSPFPYVVGTGDGTGTLSTDLVSPKLRFVEASVFVAVKEPGAAALLGEDDNVLVPEGGDVMFYGDGGAGKTTMMIDLALHLTAGDDWLGIRVSRPVRVAIIENEGPRSLFRAKLRRKLGAWKGSSLGDRLLLLEEPWSKVSLDDPTVRNALAAKVKELELDAIMLGPVTRSGMNEAGTLQQVRDYANLVDEVRTRSARRLTFLLAHHENRGGQVSGAWEGAVDTLFHVQAQGHGQTRLFVQKARWSSEHQKQKLQLSWADGEGFDVVEAGERDDNLVADEILAFVLAHGGRAWGRVEEAVVGQGDRLRTVRDSLLEGGRLVNRGSDKRMKLWHEDDPALPPGDEAP